MRAEADSVRLLNSKMLNSDTVTREFFMRRACESDLMSRNESGEYVRGAQIIALHVMLELDFSSIPSTVQVSQFSSVRKSQADNISPTIGSQYN